MSKENTHRGIQSFVRREGRLTRGQQRALDSLYPVYGLDPDEDAIAWRDDVKTNAPMVVEIGFGNGQSLAYAAAAHPHTAFLGIEVHRPGVGQLLMRIQELGLRNLRVICDDAVPVLTKRIPERSLNRVNLFFPDPWPKKRHHKRRLVQTEWVDTIASRLVPDGRLHLATDWENYAEHMRAVLGANLNFETCSDAECAIAHAAYRSITKFEARGRSLGHDVWDLVYRRVKKGLNN